MEKDFEINGVKLDLEAQIKVVNHLEAYFTATYLQGCLRGSGIEISDEDVLQYGYEIRDKINDNEIVWEAINQYEEELVDEVVSKIKDEQDDNN